MARRTSGHLLARRALGMTMGLAALGIVASVMPAAAQAPSFARRAVIPAPEVDFVRTGDLDGNGFVDFLTISKVVDGTGTPVESRMGWWPQGEPEGGDPPGYNFPTRADSVTGAPRDLDIRVDLGDVDGDGHLDLLALNPGGRLSVWLNPDGDAAYDRKTVVRRGFLSDVDHIEVADVDGDGRDDVITVRSTRDIQWYPSVGEVGEADFGPQHKLASLGAGNRVTRLTAGDTNSDGRLDFVTSNRDRDSIAWWLQSDSEAGEFSKVGEEREQGVRDLALGDMDADGDLDVLVTSQVGNQAYKVFAWLGDGSGTTFERLDGWLSSSASRGQMWGSIDTSDVNNDGRVDFVASEFGSNGHLCWYENPGGGGGTATPTATETAMPTATGTATRLGPTSTATTTALPSTATATSTDASPEPTSTSTGTPESGMPTATPTATPLDGDESRLYLPALLKDGY